MSQRQQEKRKSVTLAHDSGVEFNVFLTEFEIQQCQHDQRFASELIDKYYKLYCNGVLFGQVPKATEPVDEDLAENVPLAENTEDLAAEDSQQHDDLILDFDEEHFIHLVSCRPPLYDFKLPLKDRSKNTVTNLWEEVISELNVKMTVAAISKKWKNIRDSYIRARANINKKIASGASSTQKIEADRIKAKHRNYELLQSFLDVTLTARNTSSNLDSCPAGSPPSSSAADCSKRPPDHSRPSRDLRLADSLEKLPRSIRNNLELEILKKVNEAEELY